MSFYSIYRIVKDIARTIFGYKFWRKLLIIILVAFGLWFFLHNQGYCVEETEDINYSMYSYYENVTNNVISTLGYMYLRTPTDPIFSFMTNQNYNYSYYFYYGGGGGVDYLGSIPLNKSKINILVFPITTSFTRTTTTYDYLGLTTIPIYNFNARL